MTALPEKLREVRLRLARIESGGLICGTTFSIYDAQWKTNKELKTFMEGEGFACTGGNPLGILFWTKA